MSDHSCDSVFVDGVEDVEEVGTIRELAFRELGGEVDGDARVVLELWVEVGDGDLVVFGRVDPLHLRQLEELLLAGKNFSKEIFVCAGIWRNVEPESNGISREKVLTRAIL